MRIHFIGIGGIGISALAHYYLEKGCQISGSDLVSSEITEALGQKGVQLFIGKHKAKNIPKDADMVIYSPAVPQNNPELKKAKKLKIVNRRLKILSYPQAVGELTKIHFTIAVSGTHGKSTTSAMIGLLLIGADLNPTVIVGTKLKEFDNSNFRMGGKKSILVIEADEHFASFLNYWPKIIVLTSLEPDHLDYYKNFKNYIFTFKKFISHLPKDGVLIMNKDDKEISNLKWQISKLKINYYSTKQEEAAKLRKILKIPGEHNVSNALAALTVARVLNIPDKVSFKALSEYKGSWRRLEEKELKIENRQLKIIDDYAHHPTEVKVTLEAVREKYPKKKIWCVFQPHQYQRTYYLFNDFVEVLRKAPIDKLIVTDIYDVAGREKISIKKKVSSQKLVKVVNRSWVIYLPRHKIIDYLKKNLSEKQILIIMGAGDIYNLVKLDKKRK